MAGLQSNTFKRNCTVIKTNTAQVHWATPNVIQSNDFFDSIQIRMEDLVIGK